MARDVSSPMSTTCTSPARALPGPNSSPGFSAANVTVRVAASTVAGAAPVSASTPLGMSTASTAAAPTSGGDHGGRLSSPGR